MLMTPARVELSGLDGTLRARYDALFEQCPAAFVQQSSSWAEALAPLGDEPFLLVYQEGESDVAALPLYLFRGAAGAVANSVPQAGPLGGVFCLPGLDAAARSRAYQALVERAVAVARAEGALSLTIISNPVDADADELASRLPADCILDNFTQITDLSGPIGSETVRRAAKKAQKAGWKIEPCGSEDDARVWYGVHASRQKSIGAKPLDETLIIRLWRGLSARGKCALLLARHGGKIGGGTLIVGHRDTWDLYMPATDEAAADQGAGHLAAESALAWAKDRGAKRLNWQSSPSRTSGVYEHKRRWGGREHGYAFLTRLFRPIEELRDLHDKGALAGYSGRFVAPFALLASRTAARRFSK